MHRAVQKNIRLVGLIAGYLFILCTLPAIPRIESYPSLAEIFTSDAGESAALTPRISDGIVLVRRHHLAKVKLSPLFTARFETRFAGGIYPARMNQQSVNLIAVVGEDIPAYCHVKDVLRNAELFVCSQP